MGVHGLWKLLEPAGKPVPLESLENKVLAVDVSIWLYQLTKGLQITGGGVVPNGHILGLFNRICKLLYYRIKPVFVFDGGVPLLKKETIDARKRQKLKSLDISEKIREKLLDNLLKQRAVNQLLGSEEPLSTARPVENDLFALPPLPEENEIEDSDEDCDTELNSAKIESFCNYQYGKDVHSIDITSEQFKSLPPEIRHEILSELQETRKQSSWARIHEMPEESSDFSKYQMTRLMKRRNVQRSLDTAAKEMGGRMMTMSELEEMFLEDGIVTQSIPGKRIAADNVTRYIYVKDNKSEKKEKEKSDDKDEVDVSETIDRKPKQNVYDVKESQFRKNLYTIDQCLFANDSSSDEDVQIIENSQENDLAHSLSLREGISQEEIINLIQKQNSIENKIKLKLTSSSNDLKAKEKPFSNYSDVEDDPDIIEDSQPSPPFNLGESVKQSNWKSDSLYVEQKTTSHSPCKDTDMFRESDFQKSLSKLDKMINSVTNGKSSPAELPCCSKSLPEDVDLISESDSDDFVEVTDADEKSEYFDDLKNKTLEISIDPNRIVEDDLFADVFKPTKKKEDSKSHENVVEIEANEREAAEFKKQETEFDKEVTNACEEHTSQKTDVEKENSKTVTTKTGEQTKKLADIFQKIKNVEKQQKVYNKPKEINKTPVVRDEKLAEVQKILNQEQTELLFDYGKQERLGSTITQQMIAEAQELLQLFGLPYLTAPMEAEAQCAFLDQISLTEGTITDDSDIWLFGGQKVYKNFFDNRKYVLQFRNIDIEHFFKLSREQLIQMALLVGSDYTVGIEGIGPVTAMEILAYFSDKSNKPESEADIAETLRKFKLWVRNNRAGTSALARKVKNINLSEEFPNLSVIDAYLYPTVNESKESFTWATPDLDRIRQYMQTKFGWKLKRIDEILLPVMKRLTDRNKQTTLDAYFKSRSYNIVDSGAISKRVIQAINIMKNKVDIDVSQLPIKNSRTSPTKNPKNSSSRSPKKKGKSPKSVTKNILSSPHKPQSNSREIIPQRDKDRLEAAKRKLDAARIFLKSKRKTKSGMKKRKTLPPKADSSYLSESSNDSDC